MTNINTTKEQERADGWDFKQYVLGMLLTFKEYES